LRRRRARADRSRPLPRRRRDRGAAGVGSSAPYHGAVIAGQLSDRQRQLLFRVVEEYVATRQPVGSKTLVERAALPVSSSTVRAELADLERLGLLTHSHPSAGWVPTEAGSRIYVDALLARQGTRAAQCP